MRLPLLGTQPEPADETSAATEVDVALPSVGRNLDAFSVLADFQDVIDSAADAGLIDDESAVVFHRQLIAWTRGDAVAPVEPSEASIIADARQRAADIIDDAQITAAIEVAQVRSLTLAECDEILAAARAAAARLVDDAMATALA